jgi:hypothetical protein
VGGEDAGGGGVCKTLGLSRRCRPRNVQVILAHWELEEKERRPHQEVVPGVVEDEGAAAACA